MPCQFVVVVVVVVPRKVSNKVWSLLRSSCQRRRRSSSYTGGGRNPGTRSGLSSEVISDRAGSAVAKLRPMLPARITYRDERSTNWNLVQAPLLGHGLILNSAVPKRNFGETSKFKVMKPLQPRADNTPSSGAPSSRSPWAAGRGMGLQGNDYDPRHVVVTKKLLRELIFLVQGGVTLLIAGRTLGASRCPVFHNLASPHGMLLHV